MMFMRRQIVSTVTRAFAPILLALAVVSALPARAEPRLIMVDQAGCVYCQLWHSQIGPIYPKTPEGQFAPLWVVDLGDMPPDTIELVRKVRFTPTFVLVDDGRELARIEGYPGEDFFWGLLSKLLQDNTTYAPGAS